MNGASTDQPRDERGRWTSTGEGQSAERPSAEQGKRLAAAFEDRHRGNWSQGHEEIFKALSGEAGAGQLVVLKKDGDIVAAVHFVTNARGEPLGINHLGSTGALSHAGTAALKYPLKEAVLKGKGVELDAYSTAVSFYEGLGFTRGAGNEFTATPKQVKDILGRIEQKIKMLGVVFLDFDEADHPRDNAGKFSTSEGGSEKPVPERSRKAELAAMTSRLVGAEVQRYSEEHNEPQLAKALRGKSLKDNEPADVVIGDPPRHGVELKTMTDNKQNKIYQKASAMERKADWMRKNRADFHTIVFDDQRAFNALGPGKHDLSKRDIYYKRGFGSFRVSAMHKVSSMKELKSLLDTPTKDLPDAARPSTAYPRVRRGGLAVWSILRDFNEEDHPRDEHGRFGDKGGPGKGEGGVIFHGTHPRFEAKIRADGLETTPGAGGNRVYTTTKYAEAVEYGMFKLSDQEQDDNALIAVIHVDPGSVPHDATTPKEDGRQWKMFKERVPPENIKGVDFYRYRDVKKIFRATPDGEWPSEEQFHAVKVNKSSGVVYAFAVVLPPDSETKDFNEEDHPRDEHGRFAQSEGTLGGFILSNAGPAGKDLGDPKKFPAEEEFRQAILGQPAGPAMADPARDTNKQAKELKQKIDNLYRRTRGEAGGFRDETHKQEMLKEREQLKAERQQLLKTGATETRTAVAGRAATREEVHAFLREGNVGVEAKIYGQLANDQRVKDGSAFVAGALDKSWGRLSEQYLTTPNGRSYHEAGSGIYMSKHAETSVVVHELGHALEAKSEAHAEAALEFLRRRAGNFEISRLSRLGRGYESHEQAWDDKFIDRYVGKEYSHGATEITSMGLEYLYKDPVGFARTDPDHFRFTIAQLRRKRG